MYPLRFLVVSTLGASVSVQAAVPDSSPYLAAEDVIVVTATRTAEKRSNIPSSMEIVSGDQLDTTAAPAFIDQLKKSASVDVIQYPNGLGGISLRGLRPDFEFTINPRTLVLVDGRPSGSSSFTTIAPDSIARVEVLKGPASALYGASAIGGVVNIITRQSSGPQKGNFQLGYGSFDTIRSSARAGGTLTGPVDFDLDASYLSQQADFKAGGGVIRPMSRLRRGTGRFRAGADLSATARIDGSVDFASLDNEAPGPVSFNPQNRNATEVDRVSGDIRLVLTPRAHEVRLTIYGGREDYDYWETPDKNPRYQTNNTVTTMVGAQLQDSWRLNDAMRLTAGFDWQKVDARRLSWLPSGERRGPSAPNESRTSKGLFGEARLALANERVVLTGGGRYDWITSEVLATDYKPNLKPGGASFGVFNPRGGAVVKLMPWLRAHATIGRAFVPPQALQLAGESEEFAGKQRRLNFGNPDLKPERNTSWDIGLGLDRGPFMADITYFDARTQNRITTTTISETPTLRRSSYINAESSRMRGVEAQMRLDAGELAGFARGRVMLGASATHLLQAEDWIKGQPTPIRNVADWKVNGFITLAPSDAVSATVTVRHVGVRRDTDNRPGKIYTGGKGGLFGLAPFTTMDLSTRVKLTPHDALRFDAANLFDKYYEEKADYPQPGRTLTVRYVRSF